MKQDLVIARRNDGEADGDHFVGVNKMVKIGSGTSRAVDGLALSANDDHFPDVSKTVEPGSHGSSATEHFAGIGKLIPSRRGRIYVADVLDGPEKHAI